MDERAFESLPRFSWKEIKQHLSEKRPFEAISPMATALIRFRRYEPIFGLIPHSGHRVRGELQSKMMMEEDERQYEENLYVEQFVADYPIQYIALDSRFEYDVNRSRDQAVYLKPFQSWGKRVWNHPPDKEELEISFQKYDEFHDLFDFLVEQISEDFGKVLMFELHSYNFKRPNYQGRETSLPVFNLATNNAVAKQHRKMLDTVLDELGKIRLPGVDVTVKENDVFKGDGAFLLAMMERHPTSLVLPIEVKKIYMDELNGEPNKVVINQLKKAFSELSRSISSKFFGKKFA